MPAVAALTEPVPLGLARQLRRAVLEHAGAERRRTYPPTVHAGHPGERVASFELGDALRGRGLDAALRSDVVAALLRRAGALEDVSGPVGPASPVPRDRPLVWLTRPGPLDLHDLDVAWLAAARAAAGELGLTLPMVVVNRRAWRDPSTGVGREWTRARLERAVAAAR